MSWRFPANFWSGNQQEQTPSNPQRIPTESWYPPSVVGSSPNPFGMSSPRISTGMNLNRASSQTQSPSQMQPSPTEAVGVIGRLRDKSVDELRKILNDPDAYAAFFNSLDQVQMQNNLRDDLRKQTLQLASENLEKEPRIVELRNQCMIIRTTELASAQEKLSDLENEKEEILCFYSPAALLQKLQDAIDKTEEESEVLHKKLLQKEIDLDTFIQKYKELRQLHHRQALTHLAARTSS